MLVFPQNLHHFEVIGVKYSWITQRINSNASLWCRKTYINVGIATVMVATPVYRISVEIVLFRAERHGVKYVHKSIITTSIY